MSQVGTGVDTYAQQKECVYSQPFILALGDIRNPTEFFIVVDNLTIPGGSSALEAFDRLFKVHYVFAVHFAKPLQSFFNFFEGIVYKLDVAIKPSVRELYSKMVRVEVES